MSDVVWIPNATATRLHAVNADTTVPRGSFTMPTICRPNVPVDLLSPERVLGVAPQKCRACLRGLPVGGEP